MYEVFVEDHLRRIVYLCGKDPQSHRWVQYGNM